MDDLISRQVVLDWLNDEWDGMVLSVFDGIRALPSAQPELSEYSDKLWKKAYERGKAEAQQRWIPCSERLPEEHIGFYLVTVQKRRITALNVVGCDNTVHDIDIARWDYDRRAPQRGYHWCKADKVIAWMPLPEPYREEGEK